MDKIFETATNISTPLMLAGLFATVFFFVVRQIIKANLFPQLTRQLSGDIVKIIIQRLFVLAMLAMVFGFLGYMVPIVNPYRGISDDVKEHYELPAPDLIQLVLEDISAVNVLPRPKEKNIIIKFKVVPKSKDKFVPLKSRGDLVVIDSVNNQKKYSFRLNLDDEGIRPQIVSYIILDGLIPRTEYGKILSSNSYMAKCIIYYDTDIVPKEQSFSSKIFSLNNKTIEDMPE